MKRWIQNEAGRPAGSFPLMVVLGLAVMASAFAQTYRFVPDGFKIGGGYGSTGTTIEANGDIDTDGTVTATAFIGDGSGLTGVSGAGDVSGPASSTDNALARFDSTTGKIIQNSGATLDDSGNLTATAFIGDGSGLTGVSGAGDVSGPASSTDNALPRFDSTTGKVLQASSVIVDDSANVSGVGNLSLSGTVDGRDVATDGTKLDGIETGATADQSDAEIATAYGNEVPAASQIEMEAGTETAIRRMTPERVAQAIAALAPSGAGDALTTDPLSQFAATTSSQFAGVISDETGTGAVVLANSPSLVNANLNTPSALTLTNATGLPGATGITGDIPFANITQINERRLLGRALGAGTGDVSGLTLIEANALLNTSVGITSTDSSTAWNSDNGRTFTSTLTQATTIAATSGSGMFDGQMVRFIFTQSAGGYVISWNAEFVAGADFTDTIPANSTTSGDVDMYLFTWFPSPTSKWVLIAHITH